MCCTLPMKALRMMASIRTRIARRESSDTRLACPFLSDRGCGAAESCGGIDGRRAVRSKATGNGMRVEEVEDRFISRLLKNCFATERWLLPVAFLYGGRESVPRRNAFDEIRERSLRELSTLRMPTTQEEAFRFTDISPILKAPVKKANTTVAVEGSAVDGLLLEKDSRNRVVILDGVLQQKITTLDDDLKECIQDTNQTSTSLDLLVRQNRF